MPGNGVQPGRRYQDHCVNSFDRGHRDDLGHCASAVRAEISKLAGITYVDVDADAGTVRISGEPLPGDASLREAVEEAGYEFAG
jgi:copper chaperone